MSRLHILHIHMNSVLAVLEIHCIVVCGSVHVALCGFLVTDSRSGPLLEVRDENAQNEFASSTLSSYYYVN